jgi:UrcA family protein
MRREEVRRIAPLHNGAREAVPAGCGLKTVLCSPVVTMNFQGGTMRIRDTLMLAAGAATLLVGAANIASAASVYDVRSVNVRYDDILIDTELGNTVLYRRIVSAAVHVCGSPDIRDLDAVAAAKTCRRTAVERAVESVHSQMLSALIVTGDPLMGNPW